jgi:hypothetical protein
VFAAAASCPSATVAAIVPRIQARRARKGKHPHDVVWLKPVDELTCRDRSGARAAWRRSGRRCDEERADEHAAVHQVSNHFCAPISNQQSAISHWQSAIGNLPITKSPITKSPMGVFAAREVPFGAVGLACRRHGEDFVG